MKRISLVYFHPHVWQSLSHSVERKGKNGTTVIVIKINTVTYFHFYTNRVPINSLICAKNFTVSIL